MYLVLCRKIHAVTDHHKGTAVTACEYDQEHYVTFGRNVGQYPSDRYGSGVCHIYQVMSRSRKRAYGYVVFQEKEKRCVSA